MTDIDEWFQALLQQHDERSTALDAAHTQLRSAGLLARVTLVKYQCGRGCQIATVFKIGGTTLCAVRDYKYSSGLNSAVSVAAAREKNTLDGDRHWPGHVFDVDDLSRWGDSAGMSVNCRHYRGTLRAVDVLAIVDSVEPGKPAKPVRLGVS